MNKPIEIKQFPLNLEKVSASLYEGISRNITNIGIVFSQEIIQTLENMADEYMKYLEVQKNIPVRIDFGVNENGKLVPFEINTGFVDQYGSGLNILKVAKQDKQFDQALERLGKYWKRNKIVLTLPDYRKEVELMIEYLGTIDKQVELIDEETALQLSQQEEIFCYGYPTEKMKGNANIVPGGIGFDMESKRDFYTFLEQWIKKYDKVFHALEWYNQKNRPYDSLPRSNDLVFKKDGPKTKGDKQTVSYAKAKPNKSSETKYGYKMGFIIAQEPLQSMIIKPNERGLIVTKGNNSINTRKIDHNKTIEIRSLLLSDTVGKYKFILAYTLLGEDPKYRRLVNDSNPQGPIII